MGSTRPRYDLSTSFNYNQGKVTASLDLGASTGLFDGDPRTYRTYPQQKTYYVSDTYYLSLIHI